jgi:hypothetical protein
MIKKIFIGIFVTLCPFVWTADRETCGKLENKTALITGEAQGISRASSETFAFVIIDGGLSAHFD